MIHVAVPLVIAAGLVGTGLYALLSRRHPMLLLLGVSLILGGAVLLLVTTAASGRDPLHGGDALAVLLGTASAALTVLLAGASVAAHRVRGRADLTDDGPDGTPLAGPVDDATPAELAEDPTDAEEATP